MMFGTADEQDQLIINNLKIKKSLNFDLLGKSP